MAETTSNDKLIDDLTGALREARQGRWVVLTGAGVSHASGIPTFRGDDPEAIWHRDVTELGTFAFFTEDPAASWSWYLHRFASLDRAKPNPAHRALAELESLHRAQGGEFLLITQNIDTLHERAGSRNLVKVHGSSDRLRCPKWGCPNGAPKGSLLRRDFDLDTFHVDPRALNLPRCPACNAILRQHVLWFDESYGEHEDYQFERVLEAAETMDLLLCIGTSFSVGVTELLLQRAAARQIRILSIDPSDSPNPAPWYPIEKLRSLAEDLLPAVCERLGDTPVSKVRG